MPYHGMAHNAQCRLHAASVRAWQARRPVQTANMLRQVPPSLLHSFTEHLLRHRLNSSCASEQEQHPCHYLLRRPDEVRTTASQQAACSCTCAAMHECSIQQKARRWAAAVDPLPCPAVRSYASLLACWVYQLPVTLSYSSVCCSLMGHLQPRVHEHASGLLRQWRSMWAVRPTASLRTFRRKVCLAGLSCQTAAAGCTSCR